MTGDLSTASTTLDPADWDELRTLGHRMLDDMVDYLRDVRERPVWQPMPADERASFATKLPRTESALATVYREFAERVVPYALGNTHPGFMGWVHGGGTPVGMLAEMLAAGLNSNVGGRDHAAVVVEQQIVGWMRDLFEFPETANGLFVTGTSQANLLAVLAARTAALGRDSRTNGVGEHGTRLRAYTSRAAHGCIAKAMEVAGLGRDALRTIAVDADQRMCMASLASAIREDRDAGLVPFLIVGTAGTVDTGAVDDLDAIAAVCRRENVWFHVDGAFGALAKLSPELAPRLAGIEKARTIAFDFHKWGQVPYDAGFLLARDGQALLDTFSSRAAYLRRETSGLAAGSPWPCDLGIDLSRGFRALKTWFTLKTFGTDRLGAIIAQSCTVARHLEARIRAEPELELLAPAHLNIVCFRYRAPDADRFNAALAAAIQESGIAAPSTTTIDDCLAIRACIANHRTETRDVDALVDVAIAEGRRLMRDELSRLASRIRRSQGAEDQSYTPKIPRVA